MIQSETANNPVKVSDGEYSLHIREAVRQFKNAYLCQVLKLNGGNVSRTARTIGVSRRTIQLQLRDMGKSGGLFEMLNEL